MNLVPDNIDINTAIVVSYYMTKVICKNFCMAILGISDAEFNDLWHDYELLADALSNSTYEK